MLLESKPAINDESTVTAYLIEYAEVLFGLRVENLSLTLWPAAFTAICERFPGIQVHDIQAAFRYAEIEKRQYTTLTRDELIEPVRNYWNKKISVLQEIDAIRQKEQKEIESINNEIQFKQQAKEMYILALSTNKVWPGDEYQANAIARNMKNMLQQVDKTKLVADAKNEYISRTKQLEGNPYGVVPHWEKIYSRLFLQECLNRGHKYVED